jgi:uncharacterized membrane protein
MTAEFIEGLFEMGHWLNENFVVSFLPFATAWIARTQLASAPVGVLRSALRVRGHCL